MGSVKDLKIIKKPSKEKEGSGIFYFTDDYSVFDYGKMPDKITKKGESLCRMAAYNFEQLNKLGIKNHFLGLESNREMKIKLVRVLDPMKYDLSKEKGNYLIPLEIIFRNIITETSSLYKRLMNKEVTLEQLGLKEMPKPNEFLAKPILDVSTKLEEKDRYMDWQEALELASISEEELEELKKITLKVNKFISDRAAKLNLVHADGKIEFAFNAERELMVVDVLGTLDENRFLYNNIDFSKQLLRNYYENIGWKQKFLEQGYKAKPPKLPKELVKFVSDIYTAAANEWVGEKIFDTKSLKELMKEYNEIKDKKWL